MRLTVLGKSPAWQDAGGACSGYLVEDDESRVLLEAGNGVFAKLRLHADYGSVDAVVVSHMHADHFLDLVPFSYGLTLSPARRGEAGAPAGEKPKLFLPPGGVATIREVTSAWGSGELIEAAFDVSEYEPDEAIAVGSLRFGFREVPHFTRTFAVEVTSIRGGGRLTYGSDCRPGSDLVDFARNADLLLLEATLEVPDPEPDAGHMSAAEAGEQASLARARRLVLTHISDELDLDGALDDARTEFDGPIEVAREGAVYSL